MYTLKKKTKSTRKRYQNKKNYKKSKKQSKKQVKKQTKKHAKKQIKKGGKNQPYYWAPMRKLNYNPEFDTTLPVSEKPIEVTSPVYGCKNPVNVVKTGGQGPYVETECAYKAEGASSYGYDSPAGLSNGLITENNIQSAGAPGSTRHVEPSKNKQHSYDKNVEINDETIQNIIKEVCKMDNENKKKNYLLGLNKETLKKILTKIHETLKI